MKRNRPGYRPQAFVETLLQLMYCKLNFPLAYTVVAEPVGYSCYHRSPSFVDYSPKARHCSYSVADLWMGERYYFPDFDS